MPSHSTKTPERPARAPRRGKNRADSSRSDEAFRRALEAGKRSSTLQLLFRAARLLDARALERVAATPGLPRLRPAHTSLLPHIDLEGTRITDLAERRGISKQAVSQLVDELVQFGVLARVRDPEDARVTRVVLTERGRAGLFEGLEVLLALEDELVAAVGARKMKDLRGALLAVLSVVDANTPP